MDEFTSMSNQKARDLFKQLKDEDSANKVLVKSSSVAWLVMSDSPFKFTVITNIHVICLCFVSNMEIVGNDLM